MAEWFGLSDCDALVLDFDGVLVNTDELLYEAWASVLASRGAGSLAARTPFLSYQKLVHGPGRAQWRRDVLRACGARREEWYDLRKARSLAYHRLLGGPALALKPGARELLALAASRGAPALRCCVVTHSSDSETALIRAALPELGAVGEWVTRERMGGGLRGDGKREGFERACAGACRALVVEDTVGGAADAQRTRAYAEGRACVALVTPVDYDDAEAVLRMPRTRRLPSLCSLLLHNAEDGAR
eukprot:m51a1_g7479 hypothetical protein (245) ;mRNA; f:208719-209537